jgi:hypothetical protein
VENRIKEAKAAIAEYKNQIAQHGDEHHPFRYWVFYDNEVQPEVQKAINAVTDSGANRVAGTTDPRTCDRGSNKVKPGSKQTTCIAKAIDVHENVHGTACNIWKNAGSGSRMRRMDYRGSMPVTEALQEEIDAYQAEIDFLKNEMTASCPRGWKVDFTFVISGSGSSSSNSLSSVSWRVKHSYKGSFELTTGPVPNASLVDGTMPTMAEVLSGEFPQWWQPATGTKDIPLEVDIDDEIVRYNKEPGEGPAWESVEHTQVWKGDGKDAAAIGGASLVVDEAGKLHEIGFEILPKSTTKQLRVLEKDVFDRTEHGYGGAPTHEEKVIKDIKQPFSAMPLPVIAGELDGHRLTMKKKPLEITNDSFTFTDTLKRPPKYLEGLPGVDQKLKIRITYRVTRMAW